MEISTTLLIYALIGFIIGMIIMRFINKNKSIGLLNDAIYFLEKSTNLDPQSPTSLHSLAIALHLNKSYEREIPILKRLLEITPEDPQVLRLSVQAAAFTKNKAFGNYAISLMEIHNPGAVSLAQDFLNSALN